MSAVIDFFSVTERTGTQSGSTVHKTKEKTVLWSRVMPKYVCVNMVEPNFYREFLLFFKFKIVLRVNLIIYSGTGTYRYRTWRWSRKTGNKYKANL
jgi:hypothetical protein